MTRPLVPMTTGDAERLREEHVHQEALEVIAPKRESGQRNELIELCIN